jgi:hypothetical protein
VTCFWFTHFGAGDILAEMAIYKIRIVENREYEILIDAESSREAIERARDRWGRPLQTPKEIITVDILEVMHPLK